MMPIETGYEDINVKMLPGKCSLLFILQSPEVNFDDKINAAKNVMKNLSDVATAMIIVADNPLLDIPPVASPVIIMPRHSPLAHFRCPMSNKFTVIPWNKMSQSRFSEVCSFHRFKLTVGYNQAEPFFLLSSSGALLPPTSFLSGTLEGELLHSLISHHSLNVTFKFANMKWGALNKTTDVWNGVVGMVCKDHDKISTNIFLLCFARLDKETAILVLQPLA